MRRKMKPPIGYSDFKEIIDNECYFVDKTLFIKDIIDDAKIILLTRPRRFGKTLNLSLLRYFFEKTPSGQNYKDLFTDFNIMQAEDCYLQEFGKYPVITLTLKEITAANINDIYLKFTDLIGELYSTHYYLLDSNVLNERQKHFFKTILHNKANHIELQSAVKKLTEYLYLYYNVKPIILIDEYDTPIQAGYTYGYYQVIIDFMRGFFGAALKDNIHLHKAVLTGILRVAKENIFSGLNNLKVYSLLDVKYGEYFGFTEAEVDALFQAYELKTDSKITKAWYNGYQFGTETIYNPWSIINCISEQGMLKPYWVNTSDNILIKNLIAKSDLKFKKHFEQLLNGEQLQGYIDPNIIYSELQGNEASIWTLLLMAGYLKVTSCELSGRQYICSLQIPNKEVLSLYDDIVKNWLFGRKNLQWYNDFLDHLRTANVQEFEIALREIMQDMCDYHDLGARQPENFFHGFIMGLIASLRDEYYIISNRESGLGRYDLALFPYDNNLPAIIFEFKSIKPKAAIKKAANSALQQINSKNYAAAISQYKIKKLLKLGIAFSGKAIAVAHD